MNNNDLEELLKNIHGLEESAKWARGEIARLHAVNLELELKVKNLTYMLRSVAPETLQ